MGERKLSSVCEVDKISFPEEEEKILQLWKQLDVFQTSLKQSKDKPKFTFYDGPPFATGMPHYGHILTGTIKDIVTRWAHQTGHHVERRFGWDTHGLPVEYEIDKTHNIKGPEDVAAMGIKHYNSLCRNIVTRYAAEWEEIVTRLGRWIDFRNDYKTLYPWYMESIWWVFGQLYAKGLVYRGVKVMPFSTGCSTPLSNFEAGQNYKDTQDPSVVIQFPVEDGSAVVGAEGAMLVAWTTTPWTLPSNLALCVHPELEYVTVKGNSKEREGVYVMMEARLQQLFKKPEDYQILKRYKGRHLEGLSYTPLFDYFKQYKARGAFKVLCGTYVNAESGTGVVHQAPYFGEDDFQVVLSYGIITKDQSPICPVDDAGRFTSEVTHFQGRHVKEADNDIIKHLRDEGRVVCADRINHSYPYCWRSDTPLIYRAVPSWFIRVQHMQDKLLETNSQTYWVPNFVKEKRFANWLRDARDWAISRNRYWGTPIPLWVSQDLQEVVCITSIAELEQLSGEKVTDIHRDSIDHITIPSNRPGQPPLQRISEVFDCWFESGAMPYAQVHYPFENKSQFEDCFPADFIAEGIDQTRGWFYTLLVISTALFGRPPFKNLIVNGLVLASDGQKMSKRKKNYPDPVSVVNKYGADSLRLYLVNSPAVRGENLRFKEDEVKALLKEVFIPWLNAYRYFVQQVERLEKDENIVFGYDSAKIIQSTNVMDCWIISFTQSLLKFMKKEMKAYRLYTVTPRLVKFVDNLTNWYIRFNRKRLKGDSGLQECQRSLETLFNVLLTMVRMMSPFTPFITETMYQNLSKVLDSKSELLADSVHYLMMPETEHHLISERTEAAVASLQSVVELGRYLRDRINCPTKYPLPEVIVIQKEQQVLKDVMELESYIKEELNVRVVTTSTDKNKYGVCLKAEINFKLLGARLKGDMKKVQQAVAELTDEQITSTLSSGSIEVVGHSIAADEIVVKYQFSGERANELSSKYQAHSDATVLILLDTTPSQEMLSEGLAREIINRVQKLKKKARLVPTDEVTVWYSMNDPSGELQQVVDDHLSYIETTIRAPLRPVKQKLSGEVTIVEDNTAKIKDASLMLVITNGYTGGFGNALQNGNIAGDTKALANGINSVSPSISWVNVVYCGEARRGCRSLTSGTLLLENPSGVSVVKDFDQLKEEARTLFGFDKRKGVEIFLDGKAVTQLKDLKTIARKTVHLVPEGHSASAAQNGITTPLVKFVNVESKTGACGSVLLENPVGSGASSMAQVLSLARRVCSNDSNAVCYADKARSQPLDSNSSTAELDATTIYL
uniref:Isoleucine--tRNA ligase, cytoplasmic n=1 Tax=Hirondellea gigas TaxID=1518452 RepID=A0A6A7FTY3_9CRUS